MRDGGEAWSFAGRDSGSAGVMGSTRLEVREGVELQFLINYVKNKES